MISSTEVVITGASQGSDHHGTRATGSSSSEMGASSNCSSCHNGLGYAPNTVFLNVYDITELNCFLSTVGLGAHHAGVEVYGSEYAYGACPEGTGVMRNMPRCCPPHIMREQFALGVTSLSQAEVLQAIHRLTANPAWLGKRYHLLEHNCIHFAEVFLAALRPAHPSPSPRQQTSLAASSSTSAQYYDSTEATRGDSIPPTPPSSAAAAPLEIHWIPPHVFRLQNLGMRYLPQFLKAKFDKESANDTNAEQVVIV